MNKIISCGYNDAWFDSSLQRQVTTAVAKAVKSRAQCTTLEAKLKFCTRNIAQVFTTFSFKVAP